MAPQNRDTSPIYTAKLVHVPVLLRFFLNYRNGMTLF